MINMANKYVDFISDEDFLKEVKVVIEKYMLVPEYESNEAILKHSENTTDEFKLLYDVYINNLNLDEWKEAEIIRQRGKKSEMAIGEFHQHILGHVDGWIDLQQGHETGLDLMNEEGTIFMEIKNKVNTTNSGSGKTVFEKLEKVVEGNPNAVAYWGYIVSENYKNEDRIWRRHGNTDERIRRISGKKVYELVTGDSEALEKTHKALPHAIKDILVEYYNYDEEKLQLSSDDENLLNQYRDFIFEKD